jgi:hypothetical protein
MNSFTAFGTDASGSEFELNVFLIPSGTASPPQSHPINGLVGPKDPPELITIHFAIFGENF